MFTLFLFFCCCFIIIYLCMQLCYFWFKIFFYFVLFTNKYMWKDRRNNLVAPLTMTFICMYTLIITNIYTYNWIFREICSQFLKNNNSNKYQLAFTSQAVGSFHFSCDWKPSPKYIDRHAKSLPISFILLPINFHFSCG